MMNMTARMRLALAAHAFAGVSAERSVDYIEADDQRILAIDIAVPDYGAGTSKRGPTPNKYTPHIGKKQMAKAAKRMVKP